MCRRNHLHGCCIAAFAFGILTGYCLERWFVCFGMVLGLLVLGFHVMRKK